MALLNPVYGLILPFLLVFTVPIAIFASITTTLALSILLFRVTLVYIELAFAVIPYYLLGARATKYPLQPTKSLSSNTIVPVRRRKRRSSASSNISAAGTITPVSGDFGFRLSQGIGPGRDFEGVGGWRLDNPSDDDVLWTNINSRLELPADHVKRHRRSLTSGSMPGDSRQIRSYSPETTMTSPNTSRARTPPTLTTAFTATDGYFPQQPIGPRISKKTPSVITNTSGSSGSSKDSSILSMKPR